MDKDVEFALNHRKEILDRGNRWVETLIQFEPCRIVRNEIGPNYDGHKEVATATYTYYINSNGRAQFVTHVHP